MKLGTKVEVTLADGSKITGVVFKINPKRIQVKIPDLSGYKVISKKPEFIKEI